MSRILSSLTVTALAVSGLAVATPAQARTVAAKPPARTCTVTSTSHTVVVRGQAVTYTTRVTRCGTRVSTVLLRTVAGTTTVLSYYPRLPRR